MPGENPAYGIRLVYCQMRLCFKQLIDMISRCVKCYDNTLTFSKLRNNGKQYQIKSIFLVIVNKNIFVSKNFLGYLTRVPHL